MKTHQKSLIQKKTVKHTFDAAEIAGLHTEFRQSFANLKSVEADFDHVKASYKAKTTEAESRMETLNTTLQAGFEMRPKDCVVVFRPEAKKKDFYLPGDYNPADHPFIGDGVLPVLTEDMTQADFEQDLIQAESAFDHRVELELWRAENNLGRLIVGSQNGRWFTAIRGNVGTNKIDDRLDSEQRATKRRPDAIALAGKRAVDWLKSTLGKDAAKGFEDAIYAVVDGEKEKSE